MGKVVNNTWVGYERATVAAYEKHRLLGISDGEPGSRKTSFWLEGPSPVVVFSLDRGLESVIPRVLKEQPDKEVYVKEYDFIPVLGTDMESEATEIVEEFEEQYKAALSNARTVIIDKEDDFWTLYRISDGREAGGQQRDYDRVNSRFRRIMQWAKASDANVGFIDGMKDKWGERVKASGARGAAATGERIRKGFKELEGAVHLVLHHTGLSPDDWEITVGKVRGPGGQAIAGQTLPSCSFVEFAMQVFPESDVEEWL